MENLWNLSMPWWHFVVRGALAYLGLLILLRLAGKRSFGEMAPFDIVVLILVGGALRSAIVGHDESALGPFIAVATIIGVDRLLTWACAASPVVNRWVEGVPALLARNGRLDDRALVREGIPRAGFERELRHHGFKSLDGVAEARLEPNGKITMLGAEDG